jgi:hypothetical protein
MHRRWVRRIVQAVASAHLRRAVADPALRAKPNAGVPRRLGR